MANNPYIDVQRHLKGMDYPASKSDILELAERNGLDESLRSTLEQLPDEEFDSPVAVTKALSSLH